MTFIKDLYPNKAQFALNEIVEFVIELNELDQTKSYRLVLVVSHLENEQMQFEEFIDFSTFKASNQIIMMTQPFDENGYGVELSLYENNQFLERVSTAFDVALTHKRAPRYGFLSDFREEDQEDDQDIMSMKKLHLNMVQFYDWMYRHDTLVCEDESYKDLMGKPISKKAIVNKIKLCHDNGMKAIAYGAIYAASKAFYEQHQDWGLLDSCGNSITFIDIFHIMNIEKKCPWHQHIIDEYEKTIRILDFDGIHMDTYGFPKKAVSTYGEQTEIVYLDQEFPALINDTKQQLKRIKEDVTLIFNNVGNWPVNVTAVSEQDIIYIEVWEPYTTYEHLQNIIRDARRFSDKPILLAAYLKPFMDAEHKKAGYALKLLTAAIVASGGYHLILGENQGVLTQGYYVDYYQLGDDLFAQMRQYYDFMIRYSDLFYHSELQDVSMTHSYGDNKEYVFEGAQCSPCAQANTLWTICRENQDKKLISLINLNGCDTHWNKEKDEPVKVTELTIKVQIEKEVKNVFVASPDKIVPTLVPYQIVDTNRGKILRLELKDLGIWTIVVINLE